MEKNQPPYLDFVKHVPDIGDFRLRPLQIPEDIPWIHDWVNREYAKYWNLQDTSQKEVEAAYREIIKPDHSNAYLGFYNHTPMFLLECYWVMENQIQKYYDAQKGDYGMHILVAPAERPITGFTWHVFTTIMDFIFSDIKAERIVVEPDVRNDKIHILNKRAGFQYQKRIELPEKIAYLAFCTKEQYKAALPKEN